MSYLSVTATMGSQPIKSAQLFAWNGLHYLISYFGSQKMPKKFFGPQNLCISACRKLHEVYARKNPHDMLMIIKHIHSMYMLNVYVECVFGVYIQHIFHAYVLDTHSLNFQYTFYVLSIYSCALAQCIEAKRTFWPTTDFLFIQFNSMY